MKARKKKQKELKQQVSARKTQLQMSYEQLTEAEKYGIEARRHKICSERCTRGARLCIFLAALALLIVTVINLPVVNGQPLIYFRGMRQLASVMLVSGLFNVAAFFHAGAARKHCQKAYEALLIREKALPRETPVLVKMLQD